MINMRNPIFFFLIYDRNSNLNSYTRMFWGSQDRTHILIEECGFLGKGITTGLNAQVAEIQLQSNIILNIDQSLPFLKKKKRFKY